MNIIIAVTGGISAYKSADIVSGLLQASPEDHIKVVMTECAKKFITPFTLSIISKDEVYDDQAEWSPKGKVVHIDLAKWVDVFAVVPATKNTLAKIALGITDNLLTSIYSALDPEKKVILFPAMNTKMWDNLQKEGHITILSQRPSHRVVYPESGLLACGDVGMGKLPQTRKIVEEILGQKKFLS